jgi:hypothetical protein
MIERSKKITIGEKSFIVNFPNVGQMIDIESMKQSLTGNRYGSMASSGIASMYLALDIVDTIAFLTICVPDIAKYYNITDYSSLSSDKINTYVTVYKEQILPWYNKILMELRGITDDSEETKSE